MPTLLTSKKVILPGRLIYEKQRRKAGDYKLTVRELLSESMTLLKD